MMTQYLSRQPWIVTRRLVGAALALALACPPPLCAASFLKVQQSTETPLVTTDLSKSLGHASSRLGLEERAEPDEMALLDQVAQNGDRTIRSGATVKTAALGRALAGQGTGGAMKAERVLPAVQQHQGDIYVVPDDLLGWRGAWRSPETGDLYFGQRAMSELPVELIGQAIAGNNLAPIQAWAAQQAPPPAEPVPVPAPEPSFSTPAAPDPVSAEVIRLRAVINEALDALGRRITAGRNERDAQRRAKSDEVTRLKVVDGQPITETDRAVLREETKDRVTEAVRRQEAEFVRITLAADTIRTEMGVANEESAFQAFERQVAELDVAVKTARQAIPHVVIDIQGVRDDRAIALARVGQRLLNGPPIPGLPGAPLLPDAIFPLPQTLTPETIKTIHAAWLVAFSPTSTDALADIRLGRLHRHPSGSIEWRAGGGDLSDPTGMRFDAEIVRADVEEGGDEALVIATHTPYPPLDVVREVWRMATTSPRYLVTYDGRDFHAMALPAAETPQWEVWDHLLAEANARADRAEELMGTKRQGLQLVGTSAAKAFQQRDIKPVFRDQLQALSRAAQAVLTEILPHDMQPQATALWQKAWTPTATSLADRFGKGLSRDANKQFMRLEQYVGMARMITDLLIVELITYADLLGGEGDGAFLTPSAFGPIPAAPRSVLSSSQQVTDPIQVKRQELFRWATQDEKRIDRLHPEIVALTTLKISGLDDENLGRLTKLIDSYLRNSDDQAKRLQAPPGSFLTYLQQEDHRRQQDALQAAQHQARLHRDRWAALLATIQQATEPALQMIETTVATPSHEFHADPEVLRAIQHRIAEVRPTVHSTLGPTEDADAAAHAAALVERLRDRETKHSHDDGMRRAAAERIVAEQPAIEAREALRQTARADLSVLVETIRDRLHGLAEDHPTYLLTPDQVRTIEQDARSRLGHSSGNRRVRQALLDDGAREEALLLEEQRLMQQEASETEATLGHLDPELVKRAAEAVATQLTPELWTQVIQGVTEVVESELQSRGVSVNDTLKGLAAAVTQGEPPAIVDAVLAHLWVSSAGMEERWQEMSLEDLKDSQQFALWASQLLRTRTLNALMRMGLKTLGEAHQRDPQALRQNGIGSMGITWLGDLFRHVGARWGEGPDSAAGPEASDAGAVREPTGSPAKPLARSAGVGTRRGWQSIPVEQLRLNQRDPRGQTRWIRVLRGAGYHTLGEIYLQSPEELQDLRGMGEAAIQWLRDVFGKYGVVWPDGARSSPATPEGGVVRQRRSFAGAPRETTVLPRAVRATSPIDVPAVVREVLEGHRRIPALHDTRRLVMYHHYLHGAIHDEVARRLGITVATSQAQAHEGTNALANYLDSRGVAREEVVTVLRAMWANAHEQARVVKDQRWVKAYTRWLSDPARAADLAPPAIHARRALFLQLDLPAPPERFHWAVRPQWDPQYGFLLDVSEGANHSVHRYLMADRTGRRLQMPVTESPEGRLFRGHSSSKALLTLIAGYGPVDLSRALHPVPVFTDGDGTKVARPFQSAEVAHGRVPLPARYLHPVVVPDVPAEELGSERPVKRFVLRAPDELQTEVATLYLHHGPTGWAILGVEWAASENDWSRYPDAARKGNRDFKAFFDGERAYPPAGQLLLVEPASNTPVVEFGGDRFPLPADYTDLLVHPRAFEAETGEQLLGWWASSADPTHEPPVCVFRWGGRVWYPVDGATVERLIPSRPIIASERDQPSNLLKALRQVHAATDQRSVLSRWLREGRELSLEEFRELAAAFRKQLLTEPGAQRLAAVALQRLPGQRYGSGLGFGDESHEALWMVRQAAENFAIGRPDVVSETNRAVLEPSLRTLRDMAEALAAGSIVDPEAREWFAYTLQRLLIPGAASKNRLVAHADQFTGLGSSGWVEVLLREIVQGVARAHQRYGVEHVEETKDPPAFDAAGDADEKDPTLQWLANVMRYYRSRMAAEAALATPVSPEVPRPDPWYLQMRRDLPADIQQRWRGIAWEIKDLEHRPVRALLLWEANQPRGSRAYEALVLCLACLQRDGQLPSATQLTHWLQLLPGGGVGLYKTLEAHFAKLGEIVPALWRLQHPADGSRRDSTPLANIRDVRAELDEFLKDGTLPSETSETSNVSPPQNVSIPVVDTTATQTDGRPAPAPLVTQVADESSTTNDHPETSQIDDGTVRSLASLNVGDRVRGPQEKEGKVIEVMGKGDDRTVVIRWDGEGMRARHPFVERYYRQAAQRFTLIPRVGIVAEPAFVQTQPVVVTNDVSRPSVSPPALPTQRAEVTDRGIALAPKGVEPWFSQFAREVPADVQPQWLAIAAALRDSRAHQAYNALVHCLACRGQIGRWPTGTELHQWLGVSRARGAGLYHALHQWFAPLAAEAPEWVFTPPSERVRRDPVALTDVARVREELEVRLASMSSDVPPMLLISPASTDRREPTDGEPATVWPTTRAEPSPQFVQQPVTDEVSVLRGQGHEQGGRPPPAAKNRYTIDNRMAQLRTALDESNWNQVGWLLGVLEPKMRSALAQGNPFREEHIRTIELARRRLSGTGLEESDHDLEALAAAWDLVHVRFAGDRTAPIFILFEGFSDHIPLVAKSGIPFGVVVEGVDDVERVRELILLTTMGLRVVNPSYRIWMGAIGDGLEQAHQEFPRYDVRVVTTRNDPKRVLEEAGLTWSGLEEGTLQKTRDYFTHAREEQKTYGDML